jgi:hypothetical protein
MSKWFRILTSGFIALIIFAATFPNIAGGPKGMEAGPFIGILCISVIPFLVVAIFAGRIKAVEILGWSVQLFLLFAVFFG